MNNNVNTINNTIDRYAYSETAIVRLASNV